MNARFRAVFQMGQSVLQISRDRPDASAGYTAALARLADRLEHGEKIVAQQMEGLRDVRAATERKKEVRRTLQRAHLPHIAEVGRAASREDAELTHKCDYRPGAKSYLAFRAAARSVAAEAQTHKDILVKYGLAESVLENFLQALDRFDDAVEQGQEGRRAHVGASAELQSVADEIVQIVRVMDGLNRYRFMNDAEALAAWESASNVVGPTRSVPAAKTAPGDTPPAAGEARTAA
jgi:hypothetical protein